MSYTRFGLMIFTSTLVMFVLMYLNTYAWEHVFFSETRVYMAALMGATMAVIMLAYMLAMYENRKLNIAIFAGAVFVVALSLWLVRSQVTVSGPSYMRAMIPHHSIAIMTSERAQIRDPRVRKLAAVWDRSKHPHQPPYPYHIYKLFFICEVVGGAAAASHETSASDFFAEDRLPDLSIGRTLPAQISRMFAHHRQPDLATDFD